MSPKFRIIKYRIPERNASAEQRRAFEKMMISFYLRPQDVPAGFEEPPPSD